MGSITRKSNTRKSTRQYICPIEDCRQPCCGRLLLKEHMKEVHNLPRRGRKPFLPPVEVPDGETKCHICSKEFENKTLLVRHIRRHKTSAQPCHLCGQMVKELQVHIKIQHLEKDKLRYFCDLCGRGYKGYASYAFHKAGHTGERNYSCATCAKNYRTSSEQKKCEKAHQGIFKWNCSQCTYRTHQKNKYVRHLRTHTKSEPFQCPLCSQRTARKDYLQKHILKVHDHTSLEALESLYPDMYRIDESISFIKGDIVVSTQSEQVDDVPTPSTSPNSSTQIFLLTQPQFSDRLEIAKDGSDTVTEQWKIMINTDSIESSEGKS